MKVHSNKPDEVRFFELLRAPLIMYLSPEDKEQTIDAVIKLSEQNPSTLRLGYVNSSALVVPSFRAFISQIVEGKNISEGTRFELLSNIMLFLDESQMKAIIDTACHAPASYDRLRLLINLLKRQNADACLLGQAQSNLAIFAESLVRRDLEQNYLLMALYSDSILSTSLLGAETLNAIAHDIVDICVDWIWE